MGTLTEKVTENDNEKILSEKENDYTYTKEEKEKNKVQKRLTVVTEGGIHSIEYLNNNLVFPNTVIIHPNKLRSILPFMDENDVIFLIIKGLTDFNMMDVYAMLRDIKDIEQSGVDIYVMSNVPLGNIELPYYEYQGDLFEGTVRRVIKTKQYKLNYKGEEITKETPKEERQEATGNIIAHKMYEFNNPRVKIGIHGEEEKVDEQVRFYDEKKLLNDIIIVDRFANRKVIKGLE